jgi:SAM-dependent methyltransferase
VADDATDRSHQALVRLGAEWDELAAVDPLWAVLSNPAMRGGKWDAADFLASGQADVDRLLAAARRHDRPKTLHRALDFGCGAGRLSLGLATNAEEVVGVDVSPEMTRVAGRLAAGIPNVSFQVNDRPDLGIFPDAWFDVVLTLIVLQHLPSRDLVKRMVAELVRVTAPDGIAIIHVPDRVPLVNRFQPLRRFYALLRRLGVSSETLILRTPLQPMRMTPVPRTEVEATIVSAGGAILEAEPDGTTGFIYFVAGPAH